MSMNKESLTDEEAIQLRLQLGLSAPGAAAVDGAEPPVDTDAIAEENYAQRKAEMKREKEEKELKERIDKARNKSALNAKLKGTTLSAPSTDDSLDAKSWIKRQKKREKQRAREIAAMQARDKEEQDRLMYGEEDLAGLKVGHGVEEFEEGEDVILTLKDTGVLEGGEDELQNVNLVEDAAIKAARERKRKAQQAYTGYDDEEFDENRIGQRADVLGKYDEDFATGKVRTEGFRLGAPVEMKMKTQDEDEQMGIAPARKVKLNLDYTKEFEVSDYAKEGEAGFKKPKKKKAKRSTRRTEAEEDTMEVDGESTFTRRVVTDGPDNLVDDEDLQAALSRARRANAKKKPKIKPEDVAAQIAQRKQEEGEQVKEEDGEEDGRITFDETSEFARNVSLESRAISVKRERISPPPSGITPVTEAGPSEEPVMVKIERREEGEVDDEDDEMGEEDADLAEIAAREGMSLEEYREKIDRQMREMEEMKKEAKDEVSHSLSSLQLKAYGVHQDEAEPTVGQGVAGVLALLRHQGALKARTAEDEERERVQKQKDLWLADYRRRMAQRELERIQARGGNKDQAQREWENRMREQQEARDALDIYKNYKPDVNIVYHDEFGRQMTPKEAWKSLSHKFHGKTSGRMKTEKRLKKIAEERKQLTMNSSDTPLGMTDAFSRRQQMTGEAHMILSVGNKQSVQAGSSKRR
ncbi:U4/U6.U5 tri-snRNP-associated protein 1 [Cryptococcus neoformans Tu259-1]|uniref:U4/U6.U5 tri-snRNP-associated protein 1 n=1 Tax=Cryptococcus neoformans Tu259-1 TaxID=1230072 RepID=A0A854QF38_CRYNE|nr:U4/U6.U5 tri-snRNP-associated protein 1 [Cryptococcus neoformans var. grubii AD1-83a]OXG15859.1 U4/U6.U5 tri-snRNP-associated protein 1 [Cryptococcus neoformans var. grubii Tu259-1]OXG53330.1 U4/U6.U5 tri-snRNP-associated protein 1 [Cryptococcus neoformans var. grubii MW-RSA1955]OXG56726.1 U4/U6.U5 tri-snRNP-associated protein 1 [Cryptococcus neoformans var. grubii CHC193]OXG60168.1 U4/U6.U5 tri-snRNP-associated protein 1 [Cryptococcus neoformans var. grubii c8]OXH06287.1 U4/U6.U5 tri-snRNP